MQFLVIAQRVLEQLKQDKRFFLMTLIAPFIVVYFLKIFFDTMPPGFPIDRYILPTAGFVVFFFSFLLCSIVLVQERTQGTLERMFVNGCRKLSIIGGYTIGYMFLATIMALIVLGLMLFLFDLHYSFLTIFILFMAFWLLSLVSILIGIFVSTFAQTEAQIFPFIPLLTLPSLFLSGLLVKVSSLPVWTQWLAHSLPLYYANNIILEAIKPSYDSGLIAHNFLILVFFVFAFLSLAAFTFKEIE